MKKLLFYVLGIVGIGLLSIGSSPAASSISVPVIASVPISSPELSISILEFTDGNPDNDPWTNSTDVSSMNFGNLVNTYVDPIDGTTKGAGLWYSKKGFCLVIFTQPYGKPYEIKSTCNGIASVNGSFPAGSIGLTPVYSKNDLWGGANGTPQGDMPVGATLGIEGPAIATGKLIYSSEAGTATARIIQAYYGLPPYKTGGTNPFPGFTPIPLTQAPGTYTGTVTISIVAK